MTDKNKISFTKLTIEKEIPNETLEQIKQIVPEVIEDGKINCQKLNELVDDMVLSSDEPEHFGLNWPGKRRSITIARTPSKQTLVPVPGDGVDEDTTQNIFIEGENLEVLKLLQKSYTGKIKMIYIDPPYNTGNDFIYKDKFSETEKSYLESTGQINEEGDDMVANKKSSGRFHSNWLNMIYPRLKLAKELLTDDGVIFVSIDDNEVHNLREVMNEIFGEENSQATFVWKKRHGQGKQPKENNLSIEHEYVVTYSKTPDFVFEGESRNRSSYKNPDNDPRGDWAKHPLDVGSTREERPNCFYVLTDPVTKINYPANPKRVWAFYPPSMEKLIKEGRIIFDPKGKTRPGLKKFWNELKSENKPVSTWIKNVNDDVYESDSVSSGKVEFNTEATKYLNDLFGAKIFDYPKPISLIQFLIDQVGVKNGDLVMDFFAGSGTTADAVVSRNSTSTDRECKYIVVQIPDKTDEDTDAFKAGFGNISEICKKRIKLACKKIKEETKADIDYGFKVFKLQKESNLKDDSENFNLTPQMTLPTGEESSSALRKGWTKDGLLTEILLLEGFPLTSKIDKDPNITTNEVFVVTSSFEDREDKLLICIDPELKRETVDSLSAGEMDNFIFLESALPKEGGDEMKQILHERFKTRIKVI